MILNKWGNSEYVAKIPSSHNCIYDGFLRIRFEKRKDKYFPVPFYDWAPVLISLPVPSPGYQNEKKVNDFVQDKISKNIEYLKPIDLFREIESDFGIIFE